MAITRFCDFEVESISILAENGDVDTGLLPADLSEDGYLGIYRHMLVTRIFDEVAISLQREGRLMTYPPCLGQEGAIVGASYALQQQDWLFPSFRESGACLMRGHPMDKLFQFWSGDERGTNVPDGVNCFTMSIPVATQISHATGFAWGSRLKRDNVVTMVFFGDGASSKGDAHESMNFAGVYKLPIVFVCQNNQWAISVPFSKQSASPTIAQRALAYGFKGVHVDGNDPIAVYKAASEAVERARKENEPTLIELVTYRVGNHTTADDWQRYRSREEVAEWVKRDPVKRMKGYLVSLGIWNDKKDRQAIEEIKKEVLLAHKKSEQVEPPDIEDMFRYHYGEMPPMLQEQLDEFRGREE